MSFGEAPPSNGCQTTNSSEKTDSKIKREHPVTGVINRVNVPGEKEEKAVLHDPSIKTVMLSIDSVRKLVNLHGETARTYFREDQIVITTTTTHDNILRELDWCEELNLIRQFGPDYHIPTEYSIYQTMSEDDQKQAIDDCMEGTEWFAKQLKNHSIEILVQAKGWLDWHFDRCKSAMNKLDADFVVFYATGYQNRIYELLDELKALISSLQPSGILIIGKQSTRFLDRAPPEVVATAGTRWWRKSGLKEGRHNPTKHKWWKRVTEEKLSCGQKTLNSYK